MNDDISPLPPGRVAPEFSLRCTLGNAISLWSTIGYPVILVFYPHDREPVSAEQLQLYQDYAPDFRRLNASLLGISTDTLEVHEAFAREYGIGYPLLSDSTPTGMVARLYGVYRESAGFSARASFVVDRLGIIRYSQAYPNLLNPGVNDILIALETMMLVEPPVRDRRFTRTSPQRRERGG